MFKELVQVPKMATRCQDAPAQRSSTVQDEIYDGITKNNKDYHTGTPRNLHRNSKAEKMTCSLEKETFMGKKMHLSCTLKQEQDLTKNEKGVMRKGLQGQRNRSRKVEGEFGSDGRGIRLKN